MKKPRSLNEFELELQAFDFPPARRSQELDKQCRGRTLDHFSSAFAVGSWEIAVFWSENHRFRDEIELGFQDFDFSPTTRPQELDKQCRGLTSGNFSGASAVRF